MEEKRRAKRLPLNLYLDVSALFKQDNIKISDMHAPIEVIDISKVGIGFITTGILPVGYYFNARLELNSPDPVLGTEASYLNCVVKIVRSQVYKNNQYKYGCEFVGMPLVLDYVFENYQEKVEQETKN